MVLCFSREKSDDGTVRVCTVISVRGNDYLEVLNLHITSPAWAYHEKRYLMPDTIMKKRTDVLYTPVSIGSSLPMELPVEIYQLSLGVPFISQHDCNQRHGAVFGTFTSPPVSADCRSRRRSCFYSSLPGLRKLQKYRQRRRYTLQEAASSCINNFIFVSCSFHTKKMCRVYKHRLVHMTCSFY